MAGKRCASSEKSVKRRRKKPPTVSSGKSEKPKPNGRNGDRDSRGRFAEGNPGGPGNPLAQSVGRLRAAMLTAVTVADMRAVVAKLVEMAKDGNVPAMRELFERTLGKPQEADFIERIEQLEALLAKEKES